MNPTVEYACIVRVHIVFGYHRHVLWRAMVVVFAEVAGEVCGSQGVKNNKQFARSVHFLHKTRRLNGIFFSVRIDRSTQQVVRAMYS
jgi:hypothetical protein